MVQAGDPTGTGKGGASIWGGTFDDEFHSENRHDRRGTLSMANKGPDTNRSQFFFTRAPRVLLFCRATRPTASAGTTLNRI